MAGLHQRVHDCSLGTILFVCMRIPGMKRGGKDSRKASNRDMSSLP